MSAKRTRKRNRAKVDEWPQGVRDYLDTQLATTKRGYAELADELTEMGFPISKSSVHRRAEHLGCALQRAQDAAEKARIYAEYLRDHDNIGVSEAAAAMYLDGLSQRIAAAQEEFDDLSVKQAGELLIKFQRSAVYKERMRTARSRACKDVEQTILRRMREQIQGDAELLARITAIVQAAAEEEAKREDEK